MKKSNSLLSLKKKNCLLSIYSEVLTCFILVLKINYRELFIVWAITPQAEDLMISKLKTLSSKYVKHALDRLAIGHRSKNQASLEFLSL